MAPLDHAGAFGRRRIKRERDRQAGAGRCGQRVAVADERWSGGCERDRDRLCVDVLGNPRQVHACPALRGLRVEHRGGQREPVAAEAVAFQAYRRHYRSGGGGGVHALCRHRRFDRGHDLILGAAGLRDVDAGSAGYRLALNATWKPSVDRPPRRTRTNASAPAPGSSSPFPCRVGVRRTPSTGSPRSARRSPRPDGADRSRCRRRRCLGARAPWWCSRPGRSVRSTRARSALPSVGQVSVMLRVSVPHDAQNADVPAVERQPSPKLVNVRRAGCRARGRRSRRACAAPVTACVGEVDPPAVGASSLSQPVNTVRPSAALGGAVDPKVTVPSAGWFGSTVEEFAINRTGCRRPRRGRRPRSCRHRSRCSCP